ncbi:MAG: low molecular weight protein arginine phosphatase [Gemmatimonadota bacterium]
MGSGGRSGSSSGSADAQAKPAGGGATEAVGPPARLLFVCTGNTCRSPLAEAITRCAAKRRGWSSIEVKSAGIFGPEGSPASEHAIRVAAEHGLDLRAHRARMLRREDLEWADLVLGMTSAHLDHVRYLSPVVPVELLTHYLPADHRGRDSAVPDPIGGHLSDYLEVWGTLSRAIEGLLDTWRPR